MATARPPEQTDADRARAMGWVRAFGATLLLGVGLGVVALPWPYPLLSGVLCLAALVLGVVALARLRRARAGRALRPALVAALVLAGVLSATSLTQAVFWDEYDRYARCVRSALTGQAQDRCRAQLENALDERLGMG